MFFKMISLSLLRRRSRMIVALLAIVVGATVLAGLVTIYYDVPRQMSESMRSYGANMIFTPDGTDSLTDEMIERALSYIPARDLDGYTPYRYENTTINKNPVTFAGVDFDGVKKTAPYWNVDGAYPTRDGEVLIGANVAKTFNLGVGDKTVAVSSIEITEDVDESLIPDYEIIEIDGVKSADHELPIKVVGIIQTGSSEEDYVYLSYSDVEYLTAKHRGYDLVEVSVNSTGGLESYTTSISNGVEGLRAKLIKHVAASESAVLTKLTSLIFIVTAVVLLLTMICVATTMTAVIAERRKEIGLRKALGASNLSVVGEFLGEGLLLGGVGGILGSVLGYVFAEIVSKNVFGGSITFLWWLIPVTIIASVAVTGIACLIPIRSAVDVDPALVLKGE